MSEDIYAFTENNQAVFRELRTCSQPCIPTQVRKTENLQFQKKISSSDLDSSSKITGTRFSLQKTVKNVSQRALVNPVWLNTETRLKTCETNSLCTIWTHLVFDSKWN